MALPQTRPQPLTPDAYLAHERAADTKSEYLDGEIVMRTGASREHNRIVANLIRTFCHYLLKRVAEKMCGFTAASSRPMPW